MILIIVESAKKIKKYEEILGSQYKGFSTVGHVMDIDISPGAITLENNFDAKYVINKDKHKVVSDMKELASKASEVIIASDMDREGEMIGYNISQLLKLKNPKRIRCDELTKKLVVDQIKNPGKLDTFLINAQKTRRILDMKVGFALSNLLKVNLKQGATGGRVQSVVTKIVYDREIEIKQFFSKEVPSSITTTGTIDGLKAILHNINKKTKNGFAGNKTEFNNKEETKTFLNNCNQSDYILRHIITKKRTQSPSAPFMTSTLITEAENKFGFNGKRTMTAAQNLYQSGHITYLRTDSVNLSEEILESAEKYIIDNYGKEFYRKNTYKTKSANAQEAHEAIRPTNLELVTVEEEAGMGNDEIRLYSLIWKKTVASQMMPAEYDVCNLQIEITKNINHCFVVNGEKMAFPGYMVVYGMETIDNEENNQFSFKIPEIGQKMNCTNVISKQVYKRPPTRYGHGSLTSTMQTLDIGRPATYSSSVDNILNKEYIVEKDFEGVTLKQSVFELTIGSDIKESTSDVVLGADKKKFGTTYIGQLITNFLIRNFPKIIDYNFTATLEGKLDAISRNELNWIEVLTDFYNEFDPMINKLLFSNQTDRSKNIKLIGLCPISNGLIYTDPGAKYGPVLKLINDGKTKYASIEEPDTVENISILRAIELLKYPMELGKYERKVILLKKNKNGFYLSHGKNNYFPNKKISSLRKAINFIKDNKQIKLENDKYAYDILKGQYGKYIKAMNKTTKKVYTCALPVDEDVAKLTIERIHEIMSYKYQTTVTNKKTFKKKNKKD